MILFPPRTKILFTSQASAKEILEKKSNHRAANSFCSTKTPLTIILKS